MKTATAEWIQRRYLYGNGQSARGTRVAFIAGAIAYMHVRSSGARLRASAIIRIEGGAERAMTTYSRALTRIYTHRHTGDPRALYVRCCTRDKSWARARARLGRREESERRAHTAHAVYRPRASPFSGFQDSRERSRPSRQLKRPGGRLPRIDIREISLYCAREAHALATDTYTRARARTWKRNWK